MKSAAAHGLAELVSDDDLGEEYIIPSPFDPRVVPAVSSAVSRAAAASGFARTPVGVDAGLRLPTHGSTPAVAESA
jgi:malate dehydrogenase (oxaloacetate-decarboxylating)